MVIAGEPSGDRLGAHMIEGLKTRLKGNVNFQGIGGPKMEKAGQFASLFPFQELSHMGLDILPHLPQLWRYLRQTVQTVQRLQPDVLVTIDSPEFSFRVAKRVAKAPGKTRLIHCVAPSVWAWRPKRAQKIARFLDHLMVLFPFEPPYFEAVGLPCTFVGHPLLQEQKGNPELFWKQTGWSPQDPLLCLLPGSRVGELKRLMPIFAETIGRLQKTVPNLQVVLPTFEKLLPTLRPLLAAFQKPPLVLSDPKDHYPAMAAATCALAASGTVTLELAYHETPMVVAYKLAPIAAHLAKRLICTPYVSLVNLIAQRPLVPECLQEDCNPETLIHHLLPLLQHQGPQNAQCRGLENVIQHLKAPLGFQDAIADTLEMYLKK